MNRFSIILWLTPFIAVVDGWTQPNKANTKRIVFFGSHRHLVDRVNAYNYGGCRSQMNALLDDEDDDDIENNNGRTSDVIPQLPPIGSSESSTNPTGLINDDKPFVANHKFQIQYTCNICETRNTNTISRIAYRQGVVIARCKGCQNQHLIADHLGWTDYEGGFKGNTTNTIEDYFANDANNKTNVTVSRVNTDVFELEKILQYNADNSGAIVSDDGKLALE